MGSKKKMSKKKKAPVKKKKRVGAKAAIVNKHFTGAKKTISTNPVLDKVIGNGAGDYQDHFEELEAESPYDEVPEVDEDDDEGLF